MSVIKARILGEIAPGFVLLYFSVLKHLNNDIQEYKREEIIVAGLWQMHGWCSEVYDVTVFRYLKEKSTGLSVGLIDSVKSFTLARGAIPNLSTVFTLLYYVKGGQHYLFSFFSIFFFFFLKGVNITVFD